jgi:PilZ domain
MTARRAEAQEVIDILNRWDARMNGHQTQKRAHPRVPYSGRISLYYGKRRGSVEPEKEGITVWARNVSPKGIAFVYKGRIEWKRVLLCLDPDAGETTWMHAEIVRSRNVHNDFWDYGVRFIRRAAAEDLPSAESAPETATVAET